MRVAWFSDVRGHSRLLCSLRHPRLFAAPSLLSLSRLIYSVCLVMFMTSGKRRGCKRSWTSKNQATLWVDSQKWPPPIGDHLDFQKGPSLNLIGLKKLASLAELMRSTCSKSSDHLILTFLVLAYRKFGCIIVFRFKKYHWGFWHRCLLEQIGRGTASFR